MKKWIFLFICVVMLSGCSAQVYETLGDITHVSATQQPRRTVSLQLPEDATVLTAVGTDTVYLCGGYTIALQTFDAGDLEATIRAVSGHRAAEVTVMESICGDHKCYDFVWTAAGEMGDQVCRAVILDDSNHHYTITLTGDAASAGQWRQAWAELLDSFCLAE